ncbi:cytosine/adenosine deaminase-related metal-dependent hydrolase [Roseiarcus fermentans]|uniref:Cytosine/adenosine deaminase-related metal-dependent hydrolase n=1 Tax=Roseiarcus fermentans TaxID=1473586 RepID=A0A366F965_9HYPH|nr:amidohydrolase family protein [Roseiarcus fermentans]RBP11194.1 cytosine/adenosine deaminase-related metal-dependent hydrolase [Roseiarcus fermentans]
MSARLEGVTLLPTDGAPAGPAVDIVIADGRIAAIEPAAGAPVRRRLALPALVNAHDHCRALSPTSFGAAAKPLETWLMRLAAMPPADPYRAALAAFGRAARGGAGSVMAHYTRFHGPGLPEPMSPVDEAREIARAARDVGVRVTLAVFMRDRNPLVYGDESALLAALPDAARAAVAAAFLTPMPGGEAQIARVEAIAAAVESPTFSVQFGPSGPQWCSDGLIAAIADRSRATGRRVHMHCLETRYQRAFADAAYPEGVVARLKTLGLLSPRLTLAHCVYARDADLDLIAASGAVIATNPSSNLHLSSGIAPIGAALRRGCRVALGVDASALDEDDDIVRELRLGQFLHGGWGFETVVERGDWLAGVVRDGRFANGAPGDGRLAVGAPADILVLDLDRLDRDAVMAVEPIDLVFARATAAHIDRLIVAGREVWRDGRLTGADLDGAEAALRQAYRDTIATRAGFLAAWRDLEPAAIAHYRDLCGCC